MKLCFLKMRVCFWKIEVFLDNGIFLKNGSFFENGCLFFKNGSFFRKWEFLARMRDCFFENGSLSF